MRLLKSGDKMETVFDMSTIDYPYGVLHDQKLSSVKIEDNKFIFTFDIELFKDNYYDEEVYEKYKSYKHCDMTVEMNDEPFNYFELVSSINSKGKFKGLSLNRENFVDVINNATSTTFVLCSATYGEFKIELSVYFDKRSKYKTYNKYGMFKITLDAKKVTWNYY